MLAILLIMAFIVAVGATVVEVINTEICTEENAGMFVNNPVNCRAFYYCGMNGPSAGECPVGLYFNEIGQNCDAPHNVNCTEPFECPANEVHIFEIDNSCVDYIICVNGYKIERTCPIGLHFDTNVGLCNRLELTQCTRDLCINMTTDPNELYAVASRDNCYEYVYTSTFWLLFVKYNLTSLY